MAGTMQDEWLIAVLGVRPALLQGGGSHGAQAGGAHTGLQAPRLPVGAVTGHPGDDEPGGGGPSQAPGAGKSHKGRDAKLEDLGPQSNPFEARAAQVHIEKLALPTVQRLAVEQSQNAARDFQTAIGTVRAQKKAKTDADESNREMMRTILLTIALMPLGPVVEAAANGVAGPKLRSALAETLTANAGALTKAFGGKAVDKTFDALTGKAITNLAESFDAAKAKGVREKGDGLAKRQDRQVHGEFGRCGVHDELS